MNDVVRTEDASNFTNFLNSTGENFTYSNDPVEQQIVGIFQDYQTTHAYVNSVYMDGTTGPLYGRSIGPAHPVRSEAAALVHHGGGDPPALWC